jgi:DNA-binding PadR family transcriptional regulator
MSMPRLTELEQTVLGIVGLFEPCSGYRVRKCFTDSPSPHWSGSAGAIYPVLRRIVQKRLVRIREDNSTGRRADLYSLTPSGREEIRAWLAPPLSEEIGFDMDPLRNQVRLLGLLTKTQQRRFVREARRALANVEAKAVEQHKKSEAGNDPYRTVVCLGALRSVRSRKKWLDDVEKIVG